MFKELYFDERAGSLKNDTCSIVIAVSNDALTEIDAQYVSLHWECSVII